MKAQVGKRKPLICNQLDWQPDFRPGFLNKYCKCEMQDNVKLNVTFANLHYELERKRNGVNLHSFLRVLKIQVA
jgi:hypothetical protein